MIIIKLKHQQFHLMLFEKAINKKIPKKKKKALRLPSGNKNT